MDIVLPLQFPEFLLTLFLYFLKTPKATNFSTELLLVSLLTCPEQALSLNLAVRNVRLGKIIQDALEERHLSFAEISCRECRAFYVMNIFFFSI